MTNILEEFVIKQKSYKEQETEKTRGKKRYIERTIEEKEAEKEIKEFEDADSFKSNPNDDMYKLE